MTHNLTHTVKGPETSKEYKPARRRAESHFKFAYFTDTFTLSDYEQKKYGVVCDNSLGGGIRKCFQYYLEMHYIDGATNPIANYFDDEMWAIVKFICSDQNQEGIPFALPRTAVFSPKRYQTNLEYIADALKSMCKLDGKAILTRKCDEIQQIYGMNMDSTLAIHLMLNLFKASCIPQTSSEHLQEYAEKFLEKIDRLECRDATAFDLILRLLEQLRPMGKQSIYNEQNCRNTQMQPHILQGSV